MPQYMLVLRAGFAPLAGLSPEEMQKLSQRYKDWCESAQSQGKKLKDGEGRVLRKRGAKPLVTDGPFTETKEVLGGFLVVTAASYEGAVDLASTCPHMQFGSIEIREVE